MEKVIIDCWNNSIDEIREKIKCKNGELFIRAAHISSSIDNEEYIKKHGLLELTSLLKDNSSPISKFLHTYGINIDINKNQINYNGNTIPIYNDYSHSYLWHELYSKKTTRESFVYTDKDIKDFDYSCIKKAPEILLRIQRYLNNKTYGCINLAQEWAIKCNTIVYTFNVPMNKLVLNNGEYICIEEFLSDIISMKSFNMENDSFLAYGICNDFVINYNDMTKVDI